jgi:hypothetical protein
MLRPIDTKLLRAALASNGGGIDSDLYSVASRKRLMKAGLIQWKPNQHKSNHFANLLTITPAGKDELKKIEGQTNG